MSREGSARRMWAIHGPTLTVNTGTMVVGGDETVTIPLPSFLIEHERGLVLLDTGLDPRAQQDPRAVYGDLVDTIGIRFPEDQRLDRQLEALGFRIEDVTHVVLSHAHLDHTGGLYQFGHARLYVGAGELQYAMWPDALDGHHYRREDLEPTRGFDWHQLPGDLDLFGDGSIVILRLPGHTPGNQGLLVRLREHTFLLSGDTVHLHEAVEGRLPMPTDYSSLDARRSIERLVELRDTLPATLWIGHDVRDAARFSFAPHTYE
ncbi:N-acyl homoserine lactonase family protein [Cnuibacter physcomitrellae]|uniref:N-acyl homoserine lactonase family protein n=1 Tax=Cnuibacter physcomitrellae TaxID=1619308 RepID=UPI0021756ECA|nr:N-acyl homoserine lactonase family protein [Cnuibacter physcomitrellae]MCS5498332.1 N-acyl homoserine lactonase family protein [Cnuibacter physcomitrellae]